MKTWPTKKLDEVCEISAGGSAPQGKRFFENGEYPFFRTSDVGAVHLSDNLYDVRDYLNGQGIKGLNLFKKETILFPKSGASTFLNHRVIMGCDGYVASHLATISAGKNIDFRYLYLFLILVDAKDIAPNSSYPSLRITDIGKINISLPPLEIQRKVVKKIEELFDKITQVQSLRESATQDTNNLIPATISKIFEEGKKKGWEEINFGSKKHIEIIDGDRGKNYPKKSDFTNSGYCLFLNTSNVRHGSFDFVKCDFISKERDEILRKGKLKRGDVVLTTRGTLGNSAYYDKSVPYDNLRLNSGMVILRVNPKELLQRFLLYVLNSPAVIERIEEANSGSAQPQLPIRVLSKIHFILPPLAEQKKIVEKMDALTQKVRELQKLQSETAANLTALKQSILHKAFQGELIN